MGTPSWLYYLFAVLMLAVSAYCLALLGVSVITRRPSGRDVDVSHVFMGVAMAGMFVSSWAFGNADVWELIFTALMVWFIVRSLQSIQRFGVHLPHAGIHAAMSFAMLLMYLYPMGSSSGSMSMSSSSSAQTLDPGLGLLLAMLFFASAIFTLASPYKGASHHGTHEPAYAWTGGPAPGTGTSSSGIATVEATIATPWLEDLSHVVMCVGMGFMLVLML